MSASTTSTSGKRRAYGALALLLMLLAAAAIGTATKHPGAETWTAVAAWLTLVVAIIAAVAALQQISEARRAQMEQTRLAHELQQKEADAARALAAEAAQPYVIVYAEPNRKPRSGTIDLIIKNVGQTAAYDVQILPEQAPATTLRTGTDDTPAKWRDLRLPDSFPILAPGQEWRTVWDSLHQRERVGLDLVPSVATIRVTFRRSGDAEVIGGPFVFELDIEIWRRTTITEYGISDAAEALREISGELKHWRDPAQRGINVRVRDGDALDARRQIDDTE